jgi:hypothetical protein
VRQQTIRGRNPFTGHKLVFLGSTRMLEKPKALKSTKEIVPAAKSVSEFNVEASRVGLPMTPPLPIDFSKPYSIQITCCVRSRAVSLSDLHEESGSKRKRLPFDEDCNKWVQSGLFTHPHTLQVIEVPQAGRARFWIEFKLGKFLFPKIRGGNLRILNPRIAKLAVQCFGLKFVQGCRWG